METYSEAHLISNFSLFPNDVNFTLL